MSGLYPTKDNPVIKAMRNYGRMLGDTSQSCTTISEAMSNLCEVLKLQETNGPVYSMEELIQCPQGMSMKMWDRLSKSFISVKLETANLSGVTEGGNGRVTVKAENGKTYYQFNYNLFRANGG